MYRIRYDLKTEHELFARHEPHRCDSASINWRRAVALPWEHRRTRMVLPTASIVLVLLVGIALALRNWL